MLWLEISQASLQQICQQFILTTAGDLDKEVGRRLKKVLKLLKDRRKANKFHLYFSCQMIYFSDKNPPKLVRPIWSYA